MLHFCSCVFQYLSDTWQRSRLSTGLTIDGLFFVLIWCFGGRMWIMQYPISASSDPDIFITCNETSIMVEKRKVLFQSKGSTIHSGSFFALHWLGTLLHQMWNVPFNFYPVPARHLIFSFCKFLTEFCQSTNEELSWKTPK